MKKDLPTPSKGMGTTSEESSLMKTSAGKMDGKGGLAANMGSAVKFLKKQVRSKSTDMDCDQIGNAMAKRLNDTDALITMPMRGTSGRGESVNIDVRKIDNGYITRESRYSDGGGYHSTETYSQSKPSLNPSTGMSGNLMKGATDYLKSK